MKVKYYHNNGFESLDSHPLTKIRFAQIHYRSRDLNVLIEVNRIDYFIKYIEVDNPDLPDLDYMYFGICDEKFKVKKWFGRRNIKTSIEKMIFLFGEILINEDLCELCGVNFIDPSCFEPKSVNEEYDFERIKELFDNS